MLCHVHHNPYYVTFNNRYINSTAGTDLEPNVFFNVQGLSDDLSSNKAFLEMARDETSATGELVLDYTVQV